MITQTIQKDYSFVVSTYKLLTASLMTGAVGGFLGATYMHSMGLMFWLLVIAELGMIIGMKFTQNVNLKTILLSLITLFSGLTLGPMLNSVLSLSDGASIIGSAFLMTAVAFGGLTFYAMTTKTDFSGMGKYLFIGLILLVVASLLNIFFGTSFISLVISYISALLFCGFIVHDTQNILRGQYEHPTDAALGMYLNVLNLFVSLVNILRGESRD